MNKRRSRISFIVLIFFTGTALIALFKLGSYAVTSWKQEKENTALSQEVTTVEESEKAGNSADQNEAEASDGQDEEENNVGSSNQDGVKNKNSSAIPSYIQFDVLHESNEDVVAWLFCPDTKLDYPVVYSGDNETYLHADLAKEYSAAGTLFVDGDDQGDFTDWNTIIYGHNMRNGSMFHMITEYASQDFYDQHPIIYLYTEDERYEIQLLAGCVVAGDDEIYSVRKYSKENRKTMESLLKKSTFAYVDKEEEARNSSVIFSESSKLVTLSTCSYEYNNARYILVGELKEW